MTLVELAAAEDNTGQSVAPPICLERKTTYGRGAFVRELAFKSEDALKSV